MKKIGDKSTHGIYWVSDVSKLEDIFEEYVSGNHFLDLGSGKGQVVEFASKFTEKAYGIEIDPELYNNSKVQDRIHNNNFFKLDFADEEVLYYFLKGSAHELELIEKLNKEFKGILIINFETMKEKQVETFGSFLKAEIIEDLDEVKVYKF